MRLLSCLFALLLSTLSYAAPAEIDWLELMPEEDLQALEAMPEIIHEGAEQDRVFGQSGGLKQAEGLPAVMYSTKTVARLDGQTVRLGGYPVPLEHNARGDTTLLFLVPYPGACIHVPPPPPNQIVLVRYPQGVAIDDIYAPFWVDGTLKIEAVDNELAQASYALQASVVKAVEEADF